MAHEDDRRRLSIGQRSETLNRYSHEVCHAHRHPMDPGFRRDDGFVWGAVIFVGFEAVMPGLPAPGEAGGAA